MKKTLLLILSFGLWALSFPQFASATDSFQFAPPPYPLLNLRGVDVQQSGGFTGISEKVGDFTYGAGSFGGARSVKKWDSGGVSLGGNFLIIGGSGKFDAGVGSGKQDLSLFGMGFGVQPNFYFDLSGHDEDDFSLPIYFGPHVNMNLMSGSSSGSSGGYSYTAYISMMSVFYGWQAGLQAGINLGDSVKFVPYLDFSQDVGGTISTSVTATGYSSSTSQSVSSLPVAMTPGFDLYFRESGFSVGGASQALQSAAKGGGKTKTIIINLRWTKKFRSICGV